MRRFNLLFVFLINAVPLFGVALFGWSASTVLVLFWFENVILAVYTTLRIAVHRRLTRKRGHWRINQLGLVIKGKPSNMGLMAEYMNSALAFTMVHGVFIGVIAINAPAMFPHDPSWKFSGLQFLQGAGWMAAVRGVQLLLDVTRIKSLSYAALKSYVQTQMASVLMMQLSLMGGLIAMAIIHSGYALILMLIVVKTWWEWRTERKAENKAANAHVALIGMHEPSDDEIETQRLEALEDEEVMPA